MRRRRLTSRIQTTASRGLVVLGLAGLVVASLGIPLVQPVASGPTKDRSKPFPCQDRPCGCMSAEQCMRSCCCFSAEYRLAWAAKYQLEVPPELLAAAEHDHDHEGDDDEGDKHAAACCAKPAGTITQEPACATCESASASTHKHAADQHDACHRASSGDTADAEQQGWEVVLVIGSFASHCRGLGPHSLLSFTALPTLPAVYYHFDWCPTGWLLPDLPSAESTSFAPPTRPPCA